MTEQHETRRFTRLPDPIRIEDTITSADTVVPQPEKDEYWREVEWMLRTTGAGA